MVSGEERVADERPVLSGGEKYTVQIDPLQRGGGAKYEPRSEEEAREYLLPQAQRLREASSSIPDALRGPRTVFFATLLPNYLANVYFPSRLIRELDLVALGSKRSVGTLRTRSRLVEAAPTKTLILAGRQSAFDRLVSILGNDAVSTSMQQARSDLKEFEELRLPDVDDVLSGLERIPDDSDEAMFEAVLHPDPAGEGIARGPVDNATYRKWVRLVENQDGAVRGDYRREVGGLTFVPVILRRDALPAVAAFNPLRSLRPMPSLRPLPQILRSAGAAPAAPHARVTPMRDRPLATFDTGVDATSTYFAPFVRCVDLTGEPDPGELHGTLVTSALLYGHVDPTGPLRRPAAPVDHFRILPLHDPARDPDLYQVLDQIVSTVSSGDYDIVSLSVAPYESVEDDAEPSRWTAELDALAYERDVLVITAAGNNGERDAPTGLNRVQIPGDMVNGLAIGACDAPEPDEPWERTPYSAVGPGRPGARVQPAGLAFGGHPTRRFSGVMGGGQMLEDFGTSYSAPEVARSLAGLSAGLGGLSNGNTLRAFAAHFAVDSEPPRPAEVGHGRLREDYSSALDCSPNDVTVVFRGVAERGQVDRLVVPWPDGIEQGRVRIRWTLAYASPTDPTEAAEYTKAGLDVLFRPNAHTHTVTSDGRTRKIDTRDVDALQDALSGGATLSAHPRTEAGRGGPELQRREDGKWETIRRQSVGKLAASLYRPTLDVVYYAREGGVLITDAPSIAYTLLVTIEAADGVALYDQVRTEFSMLTPLRVRATAPVRVRTS